MGKTFSFFMMLMSANSFGASNKVCFSTSKVPEIKDLVILADITSKTVTLKTFGASKRKLEEQLNGTYSAKGTSAGDWDGKTYLGYRKRNADYRDVILVDSELLKPGNKGRLRMYARGEFFFNAVFVCDDSQ